MSTDFMTAAMGDHLECKLLCDNFIQSSDCIHYPVPNYELLILSVLFMDLSSPVGDSQSHC